MLCDFTILHVYRFELRYFFEKCDVIPEDQKIIFRNLAWHMTHSILKKFQTDRYDYPDPLQNCLQNFLDHGW